MEEGDRLHIVTEMCTSTVLQEMREWEVPI